jgi:hypothetical protein
MIKEGNGRDIDVDLLDTAFPRICVPGEYVTVQHVRCLSKRALLEHH